MKTAGASLLGNDPASPGWFNRKNGVKRTPTRQAHTHTPCTSLNLLFKSDNGQVESSVSSGRAGILVEGERRSVGHSIESPHNKRPPPPSAVSCFFLSREIRFGRRARENCTEKNAIRSRGSSPTSRKISPLSECPPDIGAWHWECVQARGHYQLLPVRIYTNLCLYLSSKCQTWHLVNHTTNGHMLPRSLHLFPARISMNFYVICYRLYINR